MKRIAFITLLVLQCVFMYSQKATVIFVYNDNNNLPGGPEGKNYAAIVKTKESKKSIVAKSMNFMKKYGFVPADTKINAIDESQSDISYDVLFPLTRFYHKMMQMDANKLYCKLRFEFHDSNVMESEGAGLMMSKTLLGKFLVHANLDPEQRKNFWKEADKYFSNIVERNKTYDKLVKDGEAMWLDADGIIKQYTDYPVPGGKYVINYLSKPESKTRLLGIPPKRWDKQIKELFDNLFKSFCLELNGDIEGVAEDGEQTWALEDGQLLKFLTLEETALAREASVYAGASASAQVSSGVNINLAGADLLKTLPGIGDVKANAIIAYRTEHGPFAQIGQIKQVNGISDSLFAAVAF